jgi:23S rRNA (uracil1939-C5)-methyltransferase
MGERLGFRRPRSNEVVDIPHCPVLTPALNAVLKAARAHLADRLPLSSPLRLELWETDEGSLELGVSGLDAGHFRGFSVVGTPRIRVHIATQPVASASPLLLPFAQANRAQNRRLVAAVGAALALEPTDRLLDLYCGSGNFVLSLAGWVAQAVGVEAEGAAFRAASGMAPANVLLERARAEHALPRLLGHGERFSKVVLDPPRAGAAAVCERLLEAGAERIVYVSCDPATLARDLAILVRHGATLERVTPWDLMPQTAHVECVAVVRGRP